MTGPYEYDEVVAALNKAADEVLEAVGASDEGVRDVVNLVVNAGVHYLERPEDSLEAVAADEYGQPLGEVLSWCRNESLVPAEAP